MKKYVALLMTIIMVIVVITGCSQADRVNLNINKEANAFNVTRRISVINMRTDKPILELIGNFSISNTTENELVVTVETAPNKYKKHYVYLNAWTMYVVEDVSGAEVSPYHYEINFLPEMIIPFEFDSSY